MKKDNKIFLHHILKAINNIEDYVRDISSEENFVNSHKTRDAVLHNFQVIGEASNNLDEEFLKTNSNIEWKKIIGMRNFIIHEYFGVDFTIVWDTIKKDLPSFKESIQKLLKKLS